MLTKVHFNKLKLSHPFGIHHGTYNYRYQIIVEIVASGYSGYGETVAIDYYGLTPESLKKSIESTAAKLIHIDLALSVNEFYNELLNICPHDPFARCAFDEAFVDLKSKIEGKSIREYLKINNTTTPTSSITLGLSDSQELINQRLDEPWEIYKLKVKGGLPYKLIEAINNRGKSWGIDANGSFDLGQAQKILVEVEQLGGIYVEQLCPKGSWDSLNVNDKRIPHLADESVVDLASAKNLSNHCDGFVLKLTKCGGITPTLEIINYARSKGKKLLAGCMTESSIGINHMLSIAPLFDYCDLDGAFLIENDNEVAISLQSNLLQLQTNGHFK